MLKKVLMILLLGTPLSLWAECYSSGKSIEGIVQFKCTPEMPIPNPLKKTTVDKEGNLFLFYEDGEGNYLGNCYQSSSFGPRLIPKEICNLCPNRRYLDGDCLLDIVPFGKNDCFYKQPILVPKKICDLCPNREYVDGNCILKKETR